MPVNFGTPAAPAAPVPAPAVAPAGAPVVKLQKGIKLNLNKEFPGLKNVYVPLSWDKNPFHNGKNHDLDICAFLLRKSGRCEDVNDIVFYNMDESLNFTHPSGCMIHSPDCTDGGKDGDDEWIKIYLDKVPEYVERIAITATIHEAEERGQNFGQVRNAVARIMDVDRNNKHLADCELTEDYSAETAIVMFELYRRNGSWQLDPVKSGFQGGLAALCTHYGFIVE